MTFHQLILCKNKATDTGKLKTAISTFANQIGNQFNGNCSEQGGISYVAVCFNQLSTLDMCTTSSDGAY